MFVIDHPRDLEAFVGREVGVGPWFPIDQDRIRRFAEVTEDHQWIHVDAERARREMPDGAPIAHGFLVLSLLTRLVDGVMEVRNVARRINMGTDRVRFTAMVPAGSRIRLRLGIGGIRVTDGGGYRLTQTCTVEREGLARPAMVADKITLLHPA